MMNKLLRKTLLYKTGVEYGDYTINHVLGCSHGCTYPCYAFMMARRFGRVKDYNDWLEPKLVENSLELLKKEIPKKQNSIKSVHLCFTTDPFMVGYPEVTEMSLEIIRLLDYYGIKCTTLTKGVLPPELSKFDNKHEWGISLVSLDDSFRKLYEPFSADYPQRLASMKNLHDMGCKTWVSIEPYPTPNIVQQDLRVLLDRVSFTDRIIFGRLHYNKLVSSYMGFQDFYDDAITTVVTFCGRRGIDYHIKEKTTTKDTIENIERITNSVFPILHHDDVNDFKQYQNYLKYVDLQDSYTNLLFMLKIDNSKLKQIIKKLSDSNNSIHFLHELIIGNTLNEFCKKNSLVLEYSPKYKYSGKKPAKNPDWIVSDGNQKVVIEVVTIDKSNQESAFETCIGLIHNLAKDGLKRNGIDTDLDFNASRFKIPTYQERLNKKEHAKQEDRFTDFCREVSDRIVTKVISGYGRDKYETDDSGLLFKIKSGGLTYMTTVGHETYRVINSILDKGKKYSALSNVMPVIVAVANSHQNRSKAYPPSEIAKLLYYPDTVYEQQFSNITDKEKHINNIQDRIEDLKVLEGILFYKIDYNRIYTTDYEYYPNPHKDTNWEIPEKFKTYLEVNSNGHK